MDVDERVQLYRARLRAWGFRFRVDAASRMLRLEESLEVLGQALTIDDMMQFAGERLGERVVSDYEGYEPRYLCACERV